MVDSAMLSAMNRMVRLQQEMIKQLGNVQTAQSTVAQSSEALTRSQKRAKKAAEEYNTSLGKVVILLRENEGAVGRVKRAMYGFLPQGTFRAINKIASTFENVDLVLGSIIKKADSDAPASLGDNFAKIAVGAGKMGKSLLMLKKGDITKPFKALKAAQDEYNYYDGFTRSGMIGFKSIRQNQIIKGEKGKIKNLRRGIGSGDISEEEGLAAIAKAEEKIANAKQAKRDLLLNANSKVLKGIGKITQAFSKIPILLTKFLKGALYFFGIASAIVIGLYLAFRAFGPQIIETLKTTWEVIKTVGMVAMAGLMIVWDGLKDILSAFFGDGDLVTLIDGLLKIAGGLLLFVAGLAITAITAGLVLLGGLIRESGKRALQFAKDWRDGLISNATKIALVVATIAARVAFVASGAWAGALAAAIGFYVAKKIAGALGFFANGGLVNTPMQVVGERGPELVSLPRGSRVHTNTDSKRMVGGGGNTFNITINARDTSDAELRRVADKIGQMINGRINRTTSSRTLGA